MAGSFRWSSLPTTWKRLHAEKRYTPLDIIDCIFVNIRNFEYKIFG